MCIRDSGKAVVITPEVNENVVKSARNIPGVLTTTARILSVYDILNAKYLVIDQAALATIEEVYACLLYTSAGSSNSCIELTLPELEKFSGAKGWVDVCKLPQG